MRGWAERVSDSVSSSSLPLSFAHCGMGCFPSACSTLPQVMVISSEGYFYAYNIDLENGGECTLMRQYSLVDADPSAMD